jgi:acyl carrier protein
MITMDALTDVFRQVFDDPGITLTPHTTADDVDGWDSLSHVNLILAVENRFNVRFKQKEILGFKNVGDLARCVDQKLAETPSV